MDSTGSSLSQNSFISLLKHRLAAIGFDPTSYSGHSFCRGAATSAAAAVGYSDYEIQLLRHWCSDFELGDRQLGTYLSYRTSC
jgi:hypothetical protein